MLALPPDELIRRKAAEVVSRPEYQLDAGLDPDARNLWLQILRWILTPFRWLFDALEGIPDALRWVIVVVISLIAVALIVHIVWSFVGAIREAPPSRFAFTSREKPITPEEIEQAAQQAESAGDFIGAVRYLFLACLLRIERAEEKPIRRGITNRELLKRYRTSPLFEPLRHFVEVIDTKWYGHDVCDPGDLHECRRQHSVVRDIAERRAHAVGA